MIRINRPPTPPAILSGKGAQATRDLCADYDRSPQDYRRRAKRHNFDSSIYGHETVKTALKVAQHEKCCFCESKVTHISHGDIEHFRPKAGHQQRPGDSLSRPGYYWLAYSWANLLFCCQICNQRAKKNYFPLMNSKKRALSHHDAIDREKPFFIDPTSEDPESHIAYREEYLYPLNGSRRGSMTIKFLQLNTRDELVEKRRDHLAPLKLLRESRDEIQRTVAATIRKGEQPNPALIALLAKYDGLLQDSKNPKAEYSSMAKALFSETNR